MRQRNDTASALYAPVDPPFEVAPGETIDYPIHVAGLTQVEDEDQPAAKPGKKTVKSDPAAGKEPTE